MTINLHDIYEKICVYEDTVEMTKQAVSRCRLGSEILDMVAGALNNIEKLTPRYLRWQESTLEKNSKITA